jgi:2'-5' RNA ligase
LNGRSIGSAIDNRRSAIRQMRLFIGLELSDAVRSRVSAIAGALRERLGPRVTARWIPPENLHITLWFIGEVPEDRAAAILQTVDAPFSIPGFDLEIRGVGAFPAQGAPRVLWIGVGAGQESAIALYGELATRLQPLGFEPERRAYAAHLTIARAKDWPERAKQGKPRRMDRVDRAALREILREFPADAGRCRIDAVTVFRSRLSPKGATYEPVLRVPLH